MVTEPLDTSDIQGQDSEKIIQACARGCGVGREIIQKISPASEEQAHRMDHHISTGSYMMQMVLHIEGRGDIVQEFLLRVLDTMRLNNSVLRTRLIQYEGQAYQVILWDSITPQNVIGDLHAFRAENSLDRMGYGTPLFRQSFILDPSGECFFVWSGEPLQINFTSNFRIIF